MAKKWILSLLSSKYIYHVLFIVSYIGFIIQGKKWYVGYGDWQTFFPVFIVSLLLMIMMIGVNTLVLMPRLRRRNNVVEYTILVSLLIISFTVLKGLYDAFNIAKLYQLKDIPYATYLWNALIYAFWFAVISSMLYITQAQHESRQELKNIKINQLETELKYLKAQINPHFLFNGLNTIFACIDKNNHQAKDALLQFSDLLRYNLYEADVDKIDLRKEAGYIENYVAIQMARSDNNLKVDLNIDIGERDIRIAPLLFVPFIENAFKYVSRDQIDCAVIRISLISDPETLTFECENSFDQTPAKDKGRGIGLENVRRRLDLLYTDAYDLVAGSKGDVWYARLKLTT